jgi:hypothetical protein
VGVELLQRNWLRISPRLNLIIFVFLISVLLSANFFASGPVFEGYLFTESLNNLGFQDSTWGLIGRPLSVIPHVLIWYFFDGSHFGYFVVSSLLMLFRGATIFLLAKELKKNVWFLSLAAMLVPMWGGIFNERFMSAQFSLNFGLLAICLYVKKYSKLSIFAMLLATFTYPPIVLSLPLSILITKAQSMNVKGVRFSSLFSHFKLFIPLALYVGWLSIIRFFGSESYDTIVSGKPHLRFALQNLFETLFVDNTVKSILILILPIVLARAILPNLNIVATIATTSLILLATAPYVRVAIHLNDPERVFFPISATVLFIFILHLSSLASQRESASLRKNSLFAYLFAGTFFLASSLHYWIPIQQNNRHFLAELNRQISANEDAKSLLIRDNTGYLGDVNTFFGDASLEDILTDGNSLLAAIRLSRPTFESTSICTPSGVKRRHPVAANFPIPTTQNCQETKGFADLVLVLTSLNPVRLDPYVLE